jgi:hypothetical protein
MRVSISISVNSESGQISCIDDNVHEGMTAEASSDVKFEIGHVLFIDIAGYSKFLINEQSELRLRAARPPLSMTGPHSGPRDGGCE